MTDKIQKMDEVALEPGERIQEIPEGYDYVTVEGWCMRGEGRGLGRSMMSFAEKLGCYSPSSNQIDYTFSMHIRPSENKNWELIFQINRWLRGGSRIVFSHRR